MKKVRWFGWRILAFCLLILEGMKPFLRLSIGLVLGLALVGCSKSALESEGDTKGLGTEPIVGKTCDELRMAAADQIAATFKAAETSWPCQSELDCTTIFASTICHPSCASYVSLAGAKVMEATIAEVNTGICAQYERQDCPFQPIPPCCPLLPPNACENGICTHLP
jgi:hypothetical protein